MQTPTDAGQNHQHKAVSYVCPMHPDEVSHEPGKCSQCGMFLVKQEQEASAPEQSAMPMAAMSHQHEDHTNPLCLPHAPR